MDAALSEESRMDEKELEKTTRYKDLQLDLERLWQKKTKIA